MAQGLDVDGSPFIDPTTGQLTRFMNSGDPVTGTGFISGDDHDCWFYLSSGPFNFAAGDTMHIIAAKIVAPGGSNLNSISGVRMLSGYARLMYQNGFQHWQDQPPQNHQPEYFSLSCAYPNPFKNSTSVRLEITLHTDVHMAVYNILGQRIRTLIDEELAPHIYLVQWDGRDDSGRLVKDGIYLIRYKAAGAQGTRKIAVARS